MGDLLATIKGQGYSLKKMGRQPTDTLIVTKSMLLIFMMASLPCILKFIMLHHQVSTQQFYTIMDTTETIINQESKILMTMVVIWHVLQGKSI